MVDANPVTLTPTPSGAPPAAKPSPVAAPKAPPPPPKPPTSTDDTRALLEKFGAALAALEDTAPDIPTLLLGDRSQLLDVARFLQDDRKFEHLALITATDTKKDIEVAYNFWSYSKNVPLEVKVRVPYADAKVASLTSLWAGADWMEREEYDLVGVVFEGHPGLRRILLPEGWKGHPLRKDYPNFQEQYVGLDPTTGEDIVYQEPKEGAW